jgi:outer membrane murein-binding lipoprotein Lpp
VAQGHRWVSFLNPAYSDYLHSLWRVGTIVAGSIIKAPLRGSQPFTFRTPGVFAMQPFNVAAACAAFALIAGCAGNASKVDTTANADDGLSGTHDQFNRMTNPCVDQAARMTGLSRSQITITNRIRTGGGPLLTLDAGGTNYSCRLEDNGTVTVFSEFAN